ncbi:hypothetical protein ACHQM5_011420 [Ranunculus cassubicifolius]
MSDSGSSDISSDGSSSESSDYYNSSTDDSSTESDSSSPQLASYNGGTDRISALPDSILHHILCFADMKEVVNTSKLSTRWRSVWKFVPTLNFAFRGGAKRFVKFVDRVFLLRSEEVNIDSLSFSGYTINTRDLENWMTVARRRHVQELYLDLKSNRAGRELPTFIFTSEEVKVLKLHNLWVPRLMCSATHLNTVELISVTLPYSDRLRKELVISCPALKDLRLIKCNHHKIELLHVSTPVLRNLVIEDPNFRSETSCRIKLSTPGLTSLVLKGRMYANYTLGSNISLVNAKFESRGKLVGAEILHQVLDALCNVRNLQVSGRSLQISMNRDWVELSRCISRLKSIEIVGIEGREIELDFFKFVLETAVALEFFSATPHEKFLLKTKKEMAAFTMTVYSLPRASPNVQVFFFR